MSNITQLIESANITRRISRLVYHCTATPQNTTVESIQRYWRDNLKWKSPGYHIIVRADGTWVNLQDFNKPANGVAGMNANLIHVSYIGGIDSRGRALDNRTPAQKQVFKDIYHAFRKKLPHITFHGHNEFANKACPSYNVKQDILTY